MEKRPCFEALEILNKGPCSLTFFDPNLGRYRSGTYDEYLQYVTAKDGGIIQLQQGGTLPNAPGGVASQEVKKELDLLSAILMFSYFTFTKVFIGGYCHHPKRRD